MRDRRTHEDLERIAWNLRAHVVRMIGVEHPGHLGGSMSLAEIVSVLFFFAMRFDPRNLHDPNRDRLVLSKGHSVPVQYAALVELGVIDSSEMACFKTIRGMLQGHPDMEATPGMEAVTGSLGQGLSIAFGMALGLRSDERSSRIYVIIGDGELAEGQIWEAAMAIARYKLGNIIAFVDRNGLQATGATKDVFDIPYIQEKWQACGWNVHTTNGHDIPALCDALSWAHGDTQSPSVIIAETVKGKGISFAEHSPSFHNGALSQEQYDTAIAEIEAVRRSFA